MVAYILLMIFSPAANQFRIRQCKLNVWSKLYIVSCDVSSPLSYADCSWRMWLRLRSKLQGTCFAKRRKIGPYWHWRRRKCKKIFWNKWTPGSLTLSSKWVIRQTEISFIFFLYGVIYRCCGALLDCFVGKCVAIWICILVVVGRYWIVKQAEGRIWEFEDGK